MKKLKLFTRKRPEDTDVSSVMLLRDIQSQLVECLETGESGATQAVDTAVRQAVHHRASDLHFEPWDNCLSLRYRIDGILHEVASVPKAHQERIIARIKILARMFKRKYIQKLIEIGAMCGFGKIEADMDTKSKRIVMKVRNSANAEGVRNSKKTVCYTFTGLFSGIAETIFGRTMICEETKCIAKGDPFCQFEIKPEA